MVPTPVSKHLKAFSGAHNVPTLMEKWTHLTTLKHFTTLLHEKERATLRQQLGGVKTKNLVIIFNSPSSGSTFTTCFSRRTPRRST